MFIRELNKYFRNNTLITLTVVAFIPFILITVIFIVNEYSLETETGYGLLDFELAWTPETVAHLIKRSTLSRT